MGVRAGQRGLARYTIPLTGLFLILFVAPLFFTVSLRDVFVLPKLFPSALGVLLLCSAALIKGTFTTKNILTPGIIALSIAIVISALFSVDTSLSILGPHQQQYYAILPTAICIMAYYGAANAKDIPPIIIILIVLIGGLLASVIAISQIGGHGFMPWSIQDGRSGGTFGSPIFLGSYLAMILPLAWAQRKNTYVIFPIVLIALVATRSRGSFCAAAGGILLIQILKNKQVMKIAIAFLIAFCGLAIFRAIAQSGSDTARFEVWKIALHAWRVHPLLGWGPDTFSLAFRQFMTQRFIDANDHNDTFIQLSAHNDFLQILTTLGIVGFIAYVFFLLRLGVVCVSAIREDPENLGIIGAIFAVFINAKFNPIPITVMVMIACLIGSIDRPRDIQDHNKERGTAAIFAGASLLAVLIVGFMCRAEWYQRNGENLSQMGHGLESAEQFNQAAITNPFDIYYTQRQLDYFWTVIQFLPGVNKDTLAAFSHNIADNTTRLHPNDPAAHELRALSYLFEGNMIGRDRFWEADNELEVAERLAPRFSSYTRRRKDIREQLRRQNSGHRGV